MGVERTINADRYPKQGKHFNVRVKVCFNYDTSCTVDGTIVRDDIEQPFRTVIKLDNGWFVLGTECQYTTL